MRSGGSHIYKQMKEVSENRTSSWSIRELKRRWLDVTIVADNANLDKEYDRKAAKYESTEITSWISSRAIVEHVIFGALVLGWSIQSADGPLDVRCEIA